MAMDRKNKKAAQVAAAASGAGDRGERNERGGREGKGGRGGNLKRDGHTPSGGNTGNRNPLLAGGSTAPTRIMPLKATLSPSAPAPPLASFGVLDDLEGAGVQLATAPAHGKQGSQDGAIVNANAPTADANLARESEAQSHPKPTLSPGPPLPPPSRTTDTPTKTQPDFGPIGSPPSSQKSSRVNANGVTFSPGTSPQHVNGTGVLPGSPNNNANTNFSSSSPFSAPGTQSVFISGGGSYGGAGGMAASLGSGLAMMGGKKGWGSGGAESGSVGGGGGGFVGMVPSSVQQRMNGRRGEYDIGFEYDDYNAKRGATMGIVRGSLGAEGRGIDTAVEDEDLEDFLPSSLTDLLTPEERSRRMSRSNSGQPPATALGATGPGFGGGELASSVGGGAAIGHRYSRSVPAPSLLGDIKSIWADSSAHPLPSSPPTHRPTPTSSFTSRFDTGLRTAGTDEKSPSMSIGSASSGMMGLSPTNASAAFLPGLHSHYLTAKAKQAQAQQLGLGGLGRGVRGTSNPLHGAAVPTLANNYLLGGGSALSPPLNNNIHTHTNAHTNAHHTYRTTPSPFDLTQHQHQHLYPQPHTARPIPSNTSNTTSNNGNDDPHQGTHLLSPSTRALQSHAPGQSLPQGLAAGYSRIHALPPPPSLASPGAGSVFGSGTPSSLGLDSNPSAGISGNGPYGGWKGTASPPNSASSGLESMFSRLSYSAATASSRPGVGNVIINNTAGAGSGLGATNAMAPPGLTRNVSGSRYPQQQQGPLSPLSGPVVNRDEDDDLFSMDG